MICRYCQARNLDQAHFCTTCGKPIAPVSSTLPSALAKPVQDVLVEHEVKYQQALAHLSADINRKLASCSDELQELRRLQEMLEQRLKALEPEPHTKITLPRFLICIIVAILVLGSTGFLWFMISFVSTSFVNSKPTSSSFDILTIASTLLILIGSLYLAYDLLGRRNGILQRVTLFITSWLAGTILYEPLVAFLLYELGSSGTVMHLALQVLLIGGSLGALIGMILGTPYHAAKRRLFSGKECGFGMLFGALFSPFFFFLLDQQFAFQSFPTFLLVTTFLGIPIGAILGGLRRFLSFEPSSAQKKRPSFFSWKNGVRGLVVGIVLWLYFFLLISLVSPQALTGIPLSRNLFILVIFAFIGLVGSIARFVFWWVNNLADRVLGFFGLVLVLSGTLLLLYQPLYNLVTKGR